MIPNNVKGLLALAIPLRTNTPLYVAQALSTYFCGFLDEQTKTGLIRTQKPGSWAHTNHSVLYPYSMK